jgi:hypothetical protein
MEPPRVTLPEEPCDDARAHSPLASAFGSRTLLAVPGNDEASSSRSRMTNVASRNGEESSRSHSDNGRRNGRAIQLEDYLPPFNHKNDSKHDHGSRMSTPSSATRHRSPTPPPPYEHPASSGSSPTSLR